jgi:hypothetical protein
LFLFIELHVVEVGLSILLLLEEAELFSCGLGIDVVGDTANILAEVEEVIMRVTRPGGDRGLALVLDCG